MKSQLPIDYRYALKMSIFIVPFFFFFKTSNAQHFNDRDSLSNLWIVTFDKSGSMSNYGDINKSAAKTIRNLKPFFDKVVYNKDRFSFYNTGILLENDITKLKYEDRFEHSFIHEKNGKDGKPLHTLVTFRSPERLNTYISEKLEIPQKAKYNDYYKYRYSFVSLIRPIVLSRVIESLNSNQDFSPREGFLNFNKIFILSITDDADIDDQWQQDYKNVSKYAPEKLNRVNETLNRLVISPFNVSAKPVGKFEHILTAEDNWKIFLHEYQTYASVDSTMANSFYLNVTQLNDSILTLNYNVDNISSFKVEFCEIKKGQLNGEDLNSKRYFYTSDSILFTNLSNSQNNTLSLEGAFQVSYVDSILGKRYKKLHFNEQISFLSNARIKSGKRRKIGVIVAFILLVAGWLFWKLVYKPRQTLFEVYDNLGNHVVVKRGCPYAFSSFRRRTSCPQSINHVAAYPQRLMSIAGDLSRVIFSSTNFIQKKKDNIPQPYHPENAVRLYLKSRYRLEMGSVPATIATKNIKEYKGDNYEKLTSGGRGDSVLDQIIEESSTPSKYYFYLISIQANKSDYKQDQRVEVKVKNENKSFIFSFADILSRSTKKLNRNDKFNLSTLNEHSENMRQQNGLIIINRIGNDLWWNIFALSHNGSPHNRSNPMDVYHFYEFCQKEIKEIDLEAITSIFKMLEKEITQSQFLDIDAIAVYLNNSKIDQEQFLEVKDPDNFSRIRPFRFIESNFKSFLYLIETKIDKTEAIKKQIYTPFTEEGRQKDIFRESIQEGDYTIYSTMVPISSITSEKQVLNGRKKQIYDRPITVSHLDDIEITFEKEKITFQEHEIKV